MGLDVRGLSHTSSTPATPPDAKPSSTRGGPQLQSGTGLSGITAIEPPKAQSASAVERRAQLQLIANAFYPVGHPNLHIATHLDLNAIGPVGRYDEVGTLKTVGLTMPHALAGEYRKSPKAKAAPAIDLTLALEHHAALTRFFLERGTKVFLMLQDDRASEAVYNTDIATAIGSSIVVASPLEQERILERAAYSGGTSMAPAPRGKVAAVEFGDFLLARRGDVIYALQGYGSMRGTEASVDRLAATLKRIKLDKGLNIQHVPIHLKGADTLHLDYATNYAGAGATRSMLVCPDAIADQNDIERLRWIFEASDRGVFTVSMPEMLDAAANISNYSPSETLIAANEKTEATAEFLRSRGITVHASPFHMTEKDGSYHCCVGQYLRA